MRKSYGGVLIDPNGKVLLREPEGHHHGHIWTFAKGRPEPGETPEETALREVLEETGVRGRILGKIPGDYDGSTTSSEYFLMAPVEDTRQFHWETLAVTWVSQEDARQLIWLTSKPKRRERDLRLLEAAFAMFRSLEQNSPKPAAEPKAAGMDSPGSLPQNGGDSGVRRPRGLAILKSVLRLLGLARRP